MSHLNLARRVDPRWDLYDDEVDVGTLNINYEPKVDEKGLYIDFLFLLQPKPPARIDEVIGVEIKRGRHPDGRIHKANDDEVQKFQTYVVGVAEHYNRSTDPPRIRGLMIAQDFTPRAKSICRHLEQPTEPRLEFKAWDRVVEETARMHAGWLEVSKRRINRRSD